MKKVKEYIKNIKISEKFQTVIKYTAIFSFLIMFIVFLFCLSDKIPIYNGDGLRQHYIIFNNLKDVVSGFFSLDGIHEYSYGFGLGGDIIGQYSYYILGDIFAYLSLVFPLKYMSIAYIFLIILRMYFIGISFIIYGNYKKLKQKNILLGAIIYTFSAYVLYAGVRHPYFLNALILFPPLLIGIDKLFSENRIFILTIFVSISLLSNFYFFYMLTVLIALYTLIKYFCEYKNNGIKFLLKVILKIILSYTIATLIASVIFLPTLYSFVNSGRVYDTRIYEPYTLNYYIKLVNGLISTSGSRWSYYGVSPIVLLMAPLLFKNIKRYKTLFVYTCSLFIIISIHYLGSFMNGLSFPQNRWSFALSFILSLIISIFMDFDFKYSKKDIKIMFLSLIAYIGLLLIINDEIPRVLIALVFMALIMLLIIRFKNTVLKFKLYPDKIMFLLIICSSFLLIFSLYFGKRDYMEIFMNYNEAEGRYKTMEGKISGYDKAIAEVKQDKSFFRVMSYPNTIHNIYIYYGINGMGSYFSLNSKYVEKLASDLNNSEYFFSRYIGEFDNRTKISSLLGTKYIITTESYVSAIPYGYKFYKKIDDTVIYENENYLGLGIFYENYLDESEYNNLSPLDKENMLLYSVILPDDFEAHNIIKNLGTNKKENIEYEIKNNNDISMTKNKIIVNENNTYVSLLSDDIPINSELYLEINGIKYFDNENINNEYKITVSIDEFEKKEYQEDPTDAYYFSNDNILINLGSKNSGKKEIKVKFSKKGTYYFDSVNIVAVDMKSYAEQVIELNKNKFNVFSYDNDVIYGTINNEKDGILQLSLPYSRGWSVYVDGKKQEVLNVNKYFIGTYIESGKHEVKFLYKSPYMRIGIVCSFFGIGLLISVFIHENKIKNSTCIVKR